MKSQIVFSIVFFVCMNAYSQFSTSTRIDFSKDKILDKNTGIRLSEKELIKIIQENPNTKFEPIINQYGDPEYYEYDQFKTTSDINTDLSKRPKNGEAFPPFVMKTINNKTIRSDELHGKFILMLFQLDFNKPFFNASALNKANTLINDLKDKTEIVSVVITRGEKNDILKAINTSEFNMEFVSNANNFNLRYTIFKFPTFILINKTGKLISYYDYNEFDNIISDIIKNN